VANNGLLKRPTCTLLLLASIGPAAVAASTIAGVWSDVKGQPVKSAQDAVQLAVMYTGIDKLKSVRLPEKAEEIAKVETFVDTTTPFFASEFTGRRAWWVTFDSVILEYDSVPPESEKLMQQYPKEVRIAVDSATGVLLRVEVIPVELTASDYPCIPSSERATASLGPGSREYYLGIPGTPPELKMFDVLRSRRILGLRAKYLSAQYFVHTCQNHDTSAAWVLEAHGIPDETNEGFTDWHTSVSASTNLWRSMMNLPRCDE
jgi:hypothetical protein